MSDKVNDATTLAPPPLREPALPDSAASNAVVKRAALAGKALMIRQALVYGSNILGSVVLARLLPPDQFGFYGIVLFAVAFLGIFGGTGFAANLIRMEDEPSNDEMRVVFTAQQLVVISLFLLVWVGSPFIASLYHMAQFGRWFFRMIGGALVITSLMVMPQIRMERELAFEKLAIIEVSQALAFNLTAVLLAWRGFGALSFSIALLIRSAVGAVLAHRSRSWDIGFKWHPPTLFRHLHFGIALQAGQFVGIVKDSISPLFVGMFLGTADVGYVTWASSLSAYAVWILMPMQRLYLPLFARLQNDVAQLRRAVSFALWMANIVAAPLTIITLALSRPITILIFGSKWVAALPLFYLFCLGNLFIPCSTPMMGLLNALGKSRKTLIVSIVWMATTWILGAPCIALFGLIGFGIAMLGVQLTNLILFWMVWKDLSISPFPAYWPAWPLSAMIGVILFAIQCAAPIHNLFALWTYAAFGGIAYLLILWWRYPTKVRTLLTLARSAA